MFSRRSDNYTEGLSSLPQKKYIAIAQCPIKYPLTYWEALIHRLLEILIPLCCTTNPVRHKQFRKALKGFSTRTLSIRLKELERGGILERQRYNEIPPRVEYRLTSKGQELVQSIVSLLQWMRKWSNSKKR